MGQLHTARWVKTLTPAALLGATSDQRPFFWSARPGPHRHSGRIQGHKRQGWIRHRRERWRSKPTSLARNCPCWGSFWWAWTTRSNVACSRRLRSRCWSFPTSRKRGWRSWASSWERESGYYRRPRWVSVWPVQKLCHRWIFCEAQFLTNLDDIDMRCPEDIHNSWLRVY